MFNDKIVLIVKLFTLKCTYINSNDLILLLYENNFNAVLYYSVIKFR